MRIHSKDCTASWGAITPVVRQACPTSQLSHVTEDVQKLPNSTV